ncbi:TIGR03086 family metal-binding protein [Streptomyces sp. NPDC058171]
MSVPPVDLGPQTLTIARLAEAVRDEQLDAPTPCPDYAVGQLLAHLAGLAAAFRDAARKEAGPTTDTPPGEVLPELEPGWRSVLPALLGELAGAWRDPAAWEGGTRVGGVSLTGAVAGLVAVDELVVHGWDLARATGQEYAPDDEALRAAERFLAQAAAEPADGGGAFGPPVPVPDGAPLLDRVIALSGRDPRWTP